MPLSKSTGRYSLIGNRTRLIRAYTTLHGVYCCIHNLLFPLSNPLQVLFSSVALQFDNHSEGLKTLQPGLRDAQQAPQYSTLSMFQEGNSIGSIQGFHSIHYEFNSFHAIVYSAIYIYIYPIHTTIMSNDQYIVIILNLRLLNAF